MNYSLAFKAFVAFVTTAVIEIVTLWFYPSQSLLQCLETMTGLFVIAFFGVWWATRRKSTPHMEWVLEWVTDDLVCEDCQQVAQALEPCFFYEGGRLRSIRVCPSCQTKYTLL